jgi:hypothetical protein
MWINIYNKQNQILKTFLNNIGHTLKDYYSWLVYGIYGCKKLGNIKAKAHKENILKVSNLVKNRIFFCLRNLKDFAFESQM